MTMSNINPYVVCEECGKRVEYARECYYRPLCYECLPPPEPLPVIWPRTTAPEAELVEFGWQHDELVYRIIWYAPRSGAFCADEWTTEMTTAELVALENLLAAWL